jgi:hypothetical protein
MVEKTKSTEVPVTEMSTIDDLNW